MLQYNHYDAVLSRGGTAELLRKELDILVEEVPISVYDVLRCIKMAEKYTGKLAITGFSALTSTAKILCDLLQLNIKIVTFENEEEVLPTLKLLKE